MIHEAYSLAEQIDWLSRDDSDAGKSPMHQSILQSLHKLLTAQETIERMHRDRLEAEKDFRAELRDAVAEARWPMDET
jgi:hypothetical protein